MMKLTQMQLDTILCLKERGEITANQVAAVLDVSLTSVYRVIRILKDKGLVLSVSKSTGCTRSLEFYRASDEVSKLTKAQIIKNTEIIQKEGPEYTRYKKKSTGQIVQDIEQNEDLIEFIRANAPYYSVACISRNSGISQHVIIRLAEKKGIDLHVDGLEPRHLDISGALPQGLCKGTSVAQWMGGTVIHSPSDTPGIVGVTRHFAGED